MRNFLTDAALRPQPKRTGDDDWATPDDLIRVLIEVVLPLLPAGPIWEPCPGAGRLVDAMQAAGRTVIATRRDFLTHAKPPGVRIVASNPPFRSLNPFVRRGFDLLDAGTLDAVVWLWRWDHLPTQLRTPWVNRASSVHSCGWRPRWFFGSKGSPRWTFAWITWLANHPGPPALTVMNKPYRGSAT